MGDWEIGSGLRSRIRAAAVVEAVTKLGRVDPMKMWVERSRRQGTYKSFEMPSRLPRASRRLVSSPLGYALKASQYVLGAVASETIEWWVVPMGRGGTNIWPSCGPPECVDHLQSNASTSATHFRFRQCVAVELKYDTCVAFENSVSNFTCVALPRLVYPLICVHRNFAAFQKSLFSFKRAWERWGQ
jgi:hypothetical protein